VSDNRPTVQAGSSASVPVQTSADKWAALCQYRKARGLCFTCGEKWARDHQCKSSVQLHVIQEVLDMFQPNATEMEPDPSSDTQAEFHLMLADILPKDPSSLTFKVSAVIQGHTVQLLVDSGSTHSFLNSKFLPLCSDVSTLDQPLRVKIADGALMYCDKKDY
jgi:hypothetical protein